jgi:hypothetical protein
MALSAQKVKTRCVVCRTMQLWMWSWKSSTTLHRFSFAVLAIMNFHISGSCKYLRSRPSPIRAALSLQCSVASCATLWVLSCIYSSVSLFVFHRYTFLWRPWSSTSLTSTELKCALPALVLGSLVLILIKRRCLFSCFPILFFYTSRGLASCWSPSKGCYRIRGNETSNKITENRKLLRCFSNSPRLEPALWVTS